jgi:GNAT superfamily N-acetyltransferase
VASSDEVRITHHDAVAARANASALIEVYAEIYADKVADPFFSVDRFAERFRSHSSGPGYELVTAELGDTLIGYAYGVTLRADTRWWNGLLDPLPAELIRETGDRTFALNEIMVRAPWQGRGVARRLHDALMSHRPEERATLLVEQENTAAKAAYTRWGWRRIGRLQPFPDAPMYEAMLLDLRAPTTA